MGIFDDLKGIFACLLQGIWDIWYPPIQASLKPIFFFASSPSIYDVSTLYTALPHKLIKETLPNQLNKLYIEEGSIYST